MQNRLLNYVLFLLSPHFGMTMTFAMLESVWASILVFIGFGLLNMLLIGIGYIVFIRQLSKALLKMNFTFKVMRILVISAILITASLSYFNLFAVVGLIPAMMTAVVSDFIQRVLKRNHYDAVLSLSDSSYQAQTADYQPNGFAVSIWFVGTILIGAIFSWLFFIITTDREFALWMAFIGGLSAFFVSALILSFRFCIKRWNLPMLSMAYL